MSELRTKIAEALQCIQQRSTIKPKVGIILGTGLGQLAERIDVETSIDYADIPGFVKPTVESHGGELLLGHLGGKPVVAMKGRFHLYEGYSQQEITFPVRVMKALGAEVLTVSNACGGLNPQWKAGDLMILEDHINLVGLVGNNPLVGPNDNELGLRFPDLCEPYSKDLIALARQVAMDRNIVAHTGVYVCVAGPYLETRAEYRMLRQFGADVVGMSTVHEAIVAIHSGMRVLGVSVITDECMPDNLHPVEIERILAVAAKAEPHLTDLIEHTVAGL